MAKVNMLDKEISSNNSAPSFTKDKNLQKSDKNSCSVQIYVRLCMSKAHHLQKSE